MADFIESDVINCLHTEAAVIGKKYFFADDYFFLKDFVEKNDTSHVFTLKNIAGSKSYPFLNLVIPERSPEFEQHSYGLIYPYEDINPVYVPYVDCFEFIQDYKKRFGVSEDVIVPHIWLKNKTALYTSMIVCFYGDTVMMDSLYDMAELFEDFTYLDGSPVGKKEEE